jgi:hypothetical protein
MAKPNGLDCCLKVIRPTRAEDAIWKAVEEAILSGMTPEKFLREVRESWAYEREEQKKIELEKLRGSKIC